MQPFDMHILEILPNFVATGGSSYSSSLTTRWRSRLLRTPSFS